MKIRLLTTLTATLLALGSWANGTEVNGIYYVFNSESQTASVTYTGETYSDNSYTGSISIPDSLTYNDIRFVVTSIGQYAFRGCTGLTSVIIPNSVTSIGQYAFRGCTGLTSITIPNSVRRLSLYTFQDCDNLKSVTLNSKNVALSMSSFKGVFGTQVEELTLGKELTTIPSFADCTNLKSVTINSSYVAGGGSFCERFGSQVKTYTLGEGIEQIGLRAFFPGFPDGGWGGEVTFQPTSLEEVYLPSTLRTIGGWAFQFCTNLKRVHIQEGLDSIANGAFTYCFNLESLHLPASLRVLGEGQSQLRACTDISVAEANPYITMLDGVVFNKDMTTLMQYPSARIGESYRIPDGVKTVQGYAMEAPVNLKSLTIPASVDSMGYQWMVYAMPEEIRMESSVPPTTGGINSFTQYAGSWFYPADFNFYDAVTLYVPTGSKEVYANADEWKKFTHIEEYDITGIQQNIIQDNNVVIGYYNPQGQRIACPQKGIVIVRYSDGTSKKMLVK